MKYDAIYARQSVDRVDSISIESQIEYCQYETRGGEYKTFIDKGYSGKNTLRPQFQAMMKAIRNGEVNRVIVYKLDRISRSVLDFMNLFTEFQNYGVEFISCTEKFDTSSPMGRAMLKIIVVFAELERETIQQRVTDAYISRSQHGFYMGGRLPYGFKLAPYEIDGKRTSQYIPVPDEVEIIKFVFELYSQPLISYGDIIKVLNEQGIVNSRTRDGAWGRTRMAEMIRNPLYVKADLDVYKFFKSQGAIIHNPPEDFTGTNGCYWYGTKTSRKKTSSLEGVHIVIAPHEGMVPSDIWIKARMKNLQNRQSAIPTKAKMSWLSGKVKCGKCGYALLAKRGTAPGKNYFVCSHKYDSGNCEGVHGIEVSEIEQIIFNEMKKRLEEFQVLTKSTSHSQNDLTITKSNLKIQQLQEEIDKLLAQLPNAGSVLLDYINKRITELDKQLKEEKREAEILATQKIEDKIPQISGYMERWNDLPLEDKRKVLYVLVSVIKVTENSCEITWKI